MDTEKTAKHAAPSEIPRRFVDGEIRIERNTYSKTVSQSNGGVSDTRNVVAPLQMLTMPSIGNAISQIIDFVALARRKLRPSGFLTVRFVKRLNLRARIVAAPLNTLITSFR